jgi:phosphatidylinositol-3,4,5-trisphosphate 3-phosphatase/dual-specificity protein phosphatase PTEN
MGYPSDTIAQGLIRNQIETVSKYLKEKHPNSYRVYNLCNDESNYDMGFFENRVEHIPMEDHNPPSFRQILQFCSSMKQWLDSSEKNVSAVHCKAGKGRTGTMISCYIIFQSDLTTNVDPFQAMLIFSQARTKDSRGVTIPSQKRYCEYYADFVLNKRIYQKDVELGLQLLQVKISQKQMENFHKSLKLLIMSSNNGNFSTIYESPKVKINRENSTFFFQFDSSVKLRDDIKFGFYSKTKTLVFAVVFNTFCFIQQNSFNSHEQSCQGTKSFEKNGQVLCWSLVKKDVDNASKNSSFDSDFKINFYFDSSSKMDDQLVQNVVQQSDLPVAAKENAENTRVAVIDPKSLKVSKKMTNKKCSFSFLFGASKAKSQSMPQLNQQE